MNGAPYNDAPNIYERFHRMFSLVQNQYYLKVRKICKDHCFHPPTESAFNNHPTDVGIGIGTSQNGQARLHIRDQPWREIRNRKAMIQKIKPTSQQAIILSYSSFRTCPKSFTWAASYTEIFNISRRFLKIAFVRINLSLKFILAFPCSARADSSNIQQIAINIIFIAVFKKGIRTYCNSAFWLFCFGRYQ